MLRVKGFMVLRDGNKSNVSKDINAQTPNIFSCLRLHKTNILRTKLIESYVFDS